MDLQNQDNAKKKKKSTKSDLLKFQKPIYQIARNEEGKVENIIAKLMESKQKPQIGVIQRSPIFDQLNHFIPLIKKSNNELMNSQIKPEQIFDAKLQQVEDSSDSSSSEGQEMQNEDIAKQKMIEQKQEPQYLQSCEQFQINILKYPYLASEEQTIQIKEQKSQNEGKIIEVQPIKQQQNYLQTLQ